MRTKQLFAKKFKQLFVYIFTKMLCSQRIGLWTRDFISTMYLALAKADLHVKTEIIKVKKGKARFTLVFFRTKNGLTRVNIGRHKTPVATLFHEQAI